LVHLKQIYIYIRYIEGFFETTAPVCPTIFSKALEYDVDMNARCKNIRGKYLYIEWIASL
jgi:hypothetical protein